MEVSHVFINVPAEQKCAAFKFIRKIGFYMYNLFTFQNQYCMLKWFLECILKSRLMAHLGKRLKLKFKSCFSRVIRSFMAIVYKSRVN